MNYIQKILISFIRGIRPYLGPVGGTCIYPFTCSEYSRAALKELPLYKALFKITFRLLSCNPLTPLFKKLLNSLKSF